MSVTAVSARVYTVEKVHTTIYCFQNVGRGSDTHQIRWLFQWQMRYGHIQDMVHFFMAFSYSQSTYRITIQIHLTDRFCVIDTDIIKDSSLIDTEQQLIFIDRIFQAVQSGHLGFTSCQPTGGSCHGILHIASFCHAGRALIESHRNGGSQVGLDLHTLFRSHEDLVTIDVGTESYAFFLDLS